MDGRRCGRDGERSGRKWSRPFIDAFPFIMKYSPQGAALLNLACGTKMDPRWNNLDFSPYARLRQRMWLARLMRSAGLISDERWSRLNAIEPGLICWDLRKGIPFPDQSFDALYHSHFLEHLPRAAALPFLRECFRVCRRGGVIRVVVPDLQRLAMRYLDAVRRIEAGSDAWNDYDASLDELFEQMVRTEPVGGGQQKPLVRFLERWLRGGAGATGESHRWMYDRLSLARLLAGAGFGDVAVSSFDTSRIANWSAFRLDQDESGSEYKPLSLYVEAVRP
jgi:SAM-dependent methyltransferase